jgi:hypothetical protein
MIMKSAFIDGSLGERSSDQIVASNQVIVSHHIGCCLLIAGRDLSHMSDADHRTREVHTILTLGSIVFA